MNEPAADERDDTRLYSPTGIPWCHFEAGSLYCQNDPCRNPNHREAPTPDDEEPLL